MPHVKCEIEQEEREYATLYKLPDCAPMFFIEFHNSVY